MRPRRRTATDPAHWRRQLRERWNTVVASSSLLQAVLRIPNPHPFVPPSAPFGPSLVPGGGASDTPRGTGFAGGQTAAESGGASRTAAPVVPLRETLEPYLNSPRCVQLDLSSLVIYDATEIVSPVVRNAVQLIRFDRDQDTQMRIHEFEVVDQNTYLHGVGRVNEQESGRKWMFFVLEEKKSTRNEWTAFGCPVEAVRKMSEETVRITHTDGDQTEVRRVTLLLAYGGTPILGGSTVDSPMWRTIIEAMSVGGCLLTYFYNPYPFTYERNSDPHGGQSDAQEHSGWSAV